MHGSVSRHHNFGQCKKPVNDLAGRFDIYSLLEAKSQHSNSPTSITNLLEKFWTRSFNKSPGPAHNIVYKFDPADPFDEKKTFKSFDEAAVHAAMHIKKITDQQQAPPEYGVRVIDAGSEYKLGRLMVGEDEGTDPYPSFHKDRKPYYPSMHSHPPVKTHLYNINFKRRVYGKGPLSGTQLSDFLKERASWRGHLSPPDFRFLADTAPIGDFRKHALFDSETSRLIIFSLHKDQRPPFYNGEYFVDRSVELRSFIDNNRKNKTLKVDIYKLDDEKAILCSKNCQNESNTYFVDNYSWYGILPKSIKAY